MQLKVIYKRNNKNFFLITINSFHWDEPEKIDKVEYDKVIYFKVLIS